MSKFTFFCNKSKKHDLEWQNLAYFDVETGDYNEKWTDEHKNARKPLVQWCLIIPTHKIMKNKYKAIKNLFYKKEVKTYFDEKFLVVVDRCKENENKNLNGTLQQLLNCVTCNVAGFNSNKFDSISLLNNDEGLFEDFKINIDSTIKIKFKNRKTYLTIFDLIDWAKVCKCGSLKKLGKLVKLDKKEREFPSLEDFILYNIIDCEILLHFVKMLNKMDFYESRMPKAARKYLGQVFLKEGIESVYSSDNYNNFVHYGARCENYYAKMKNGYYFDVNSLYPSVMCLFEYPTLNKEKKYATSKLNKISKNSTEILKLQEYIKNLNIFKFNTYQDLLDNYYKNIGHVLYTAKVKIYKSTDDDVNFMFPYAYKIGWDLAGDLHWKHDEEVTYEIFGYEILWLSLVDTFEIQEIYCTKSSPSILKEQYTKMFNIKKDARKHNDESRAMASKILMNASYGNAIPRDGKLIYLTTKKDTKYFEELFEFINSFVTTKNMIKAVSIFPENE
jgi:hypothetical protein